MRRIKTAPLFDHLVCAGEQLRRDFEAERFRGLEVDHQLVANERSPSMPYRRVSIERAGLRHPGGFHISVYFFNGAREVLPTTWTTL
jgi:hypothetical protein